MQILLKDVDSKIPNLALMKISTWFKKWGDAIGFDTPDPELVYVSCIFKKNNNFEEIKKLYPKARIVYGGPGYSLDSKLPDEVEFLKPDYNLYPNQAYSMGFTTRGCIRNCYFCIVPKKEGKLTRWQHPREFHDPRFNTIMIMDNNWLADKDWFFETSNWIVDNKLSVIEDGMDIRLLTDDIAEQLHEMKWAKPIHFAFDHENEAQAVHDGIKILNAHKISTRHKCLFYVYVHSPEALESGLARCRLLKDWGATAFVMYNIDKEPTKEINRLRRWANRPMLFWKIDFAEYDRSRIEKESRARRRERVLLETVK